MPIKGPGSTSHRQRYHHRGLLALVYWTIGVPPRAVKQIIASTSTQILQRRA